jgi:hypothetical protein
MGAIICYTNSSIEIAAFKLGLVDIISIEEFV